MKNKISRRDFIKSGLITGAAVSMINPSLAFGANTEKAELWVIHGKNNKKLMDKCYEIIRANGAFGGKIKNLTLKINSAWSRSPEVGANTDPELVGEFLAKCRESGINKLVLPENPCNSARTSFVRSGILKAAKENDAVMIDLKGKKQFFRKEKIPQGKILKEAEVAEQFLNCDALVNMPVAKHHSGAVLSMAMKNWMGAVEDRRFWHRNGLNQCIADFCTFIKPQWTIIDATRIMLDSGPQGPTKNMKFPHKLILSRDQVAADTYTAIELFGKSIDQVKYLRIAGNMGIGVNSIADMNIHKVEV